jgi:hypothetical protein
MIRLIKHVAFAIAFAGMYCVGGWCLGAFIAQFAFEMPLWLYHAIRFAIQLSGHDELDNLDDIETLALAGMIAMCCIVVAITLAITLRIVAHYVRIRKRRAATTI